MTDFEFLKQNGRTVLFEYWLLDKNDTVKKQLFNVRDATVTYDALTELKSSAKITMQHDNDIDYINDRIKVGCSVMCGAEIRDYPLGTFLISSPGRGIDGNSVTREIEAYSKLQIYNDDKVETRYTVNAGTNVVNEVIRLLGTFLYRIAASDKVLAANREWEIGTSKLTIINDLLETINYTSLRVASDGYFEATPYILPSERPVDFMYIDDNKSIISPEMSDDMDFFDVPNVFIRYTNNPDTAILRSVHVNDNPLSLTSTVSRGRRIVSCEEVQDVADQATLNDITRRDANNASQIYSHLNFSTAIMPIHSYLNTLRVKHKDIVDGIYEETGWEIKCKAGEYMTHRVRKVVRV